VLGCVEGLVLGLEERFTLLVGLETFPLPALTGLSIELLPLVDPDLE